MANVPFIFLWITLGLVQPLASLQNANDDPSVAIESILLNRRSSDHSSSGSTGLWQMALSCAVAEDDDKLLERVFFPSDCLSVNSDSISYAGLHGGFKCSRMLMRRFFQIDSDARFGVLQGAVRNKLDVMSLVAEISTGDVQRIALFAIDTNGVANSLDLVKYAQERFEAETEGGARMPPNGLHLLLAAKSGSRAESERLLEVYAKNADQGQVLVSAAEVALLSLRAGDVDNAHMLASKWINDDVYLYMIHQRIIKSALRAGDIELARRYCSNGDRNLSGAMEAIEEWEVLHGVREIAEPYDNVRKIYLAARQLEVGGKNSPDAMRTAIARLLGTGNNYDRADCETLLSAAKILLKLAYKSGASEDVEGIYQFLIKNWETGFSSEYFSRPSGHAEANMFILTDVASICASHQDYSKAEQCCNIIADRIGLESALFLPSVRAIALCGCDHPLKNDGSRLSEFERQYCLFCSGYAAELRVRSGSRRGPQSDDEEASLEWAVGRRFCRTGQSIPDALELSTLRWLPGER